MALRAGVGASALPSELIVHIFSFLSERDRLRASSVCSRWRECVFYPALWSRFPLRLGTGSASSSGPEEEEPRLEFLVRRFGWFVRELQLELCPPEGTEPPSEEGCRTATLTYLHQVQRVLSQLRNNRNMQKLSLYGDTLMLLDDVLQDDGSLDPGGKKIKEIQQLFSDFLSNSRQLRSLWCSFLPGVVTPGSLSLLSGPSAGALEHLSLVAHQTPGLLRGPELRRLTNLRSLGLDFCDFTPGLCELLSDPGRAPLLRLSLLLTCAGGPGPSDSQLRALAGSSPELRVFLMALDVSDAVLEGALWPGLPLQRLHVDGYSCSPSEATLERVSLQYPRTLTHFSIARDDGRFPDLGTNEDPLVLLAWRCVHLTALIVHGYTVWSHNLVAISRLRGAALQVLDVPEECIHIDPDQALFSKGDPMHTLVREVSRGLCRAWHPSLRAQVEEPTLHFHRHLQSFSQS